MRRPLLVGLLCGIVGCGMLNAGEPAAPVAPSKPAVEANAAGKAPGTSLDYTLQPGDLIEMQVFQEDDLKRDVRISQEYTVTLPLIGTVDLQGKTVRQAQQMIQDLYNKNYLVNPQVNLLVLEYAPRTVNVLGAVNKAGTVDFPPEQPMNLLDAITKAGGFSRLADRSKVKLTRTLPDGTTKSYIIDADDIIKGKSKDQWPLKKDDVIYVPERLF